MKSKCEGIAPSKEAVEAMMDKSKSKKKSLFGKKVKK